jgi:hypothetical protein
MGSITLVSADRDQVAEVLAPPDNHVGLDNPREIDKLTGLSAVKAASNMDVEGWSGDLAHTIR